MVKYIAVVGFPGYMIGDNGAVWSKKRHWKHGTWRRLKPRLNTGYVAVILHRNGRTYNRYVHRLMLEAFVGPCPKGMEARHYPDRTKTNNSLDNLSWAPIQTNHDDKKEHGTNTCSPGERHWNSKLTDEIVRKIRKLYATGHYRQIDLARRYGVSRAVVGCIILRKAWRHVK